MSLQTATRLKSLQTASVRKRFTVHLSPNILHPDFISVTPDTHLTSMKWMECHLLLTTPFSSDLLWWPRLDWAVDDVVNRVWRLLAGDWKEVLDTVATIAAEDRWQKARSSCSGEPSAFVTQNFYSGVKRSGDWIAIDYICNIWVCSSSLCLCVYVPGGWISAVQYSIFFYIMNYLSTNTFNEIDIYYFFFFSFFFFSLKKKQTLFVFTEQ